MVVEDGGQEKSPESELNLKENAISLSSYDWLASFHRDLIAGAVMAGMVHTVVAPIERAKLLLQTQESNAAIIRMPHRRFKGMVDCLVRTVREEGILSLWRGNGSSVLRYYPSVALNFSLKNSVTIYAVAPITDTPTMTLVPAPAAANHVSASLAADHLPPSPAADPLPHPAAGDHLPSPPDGNPLLAPAVDDSLLAPSTDILVSTFTIEVGQQYIKEMALKRHREYFYTVFQVFTATGSLFAEISTTLFINLGGKEALQAWRYSIGTAMIPASVIAIVSILVPETPNFLIKSGRMDEARVILRRIRGVQDVEDELSQIVASDEQLSTVRHPWKNLLERRYLPQLITASLVTLFRELTGADAIIDYGLMIFQTFGFGSDSISLSLVTICAVNVVGTILSFYLLKWFSRRSLFVEGGIQMFISQMISAICIGFLIKNNDTDHPGWYSNVILTALCIFLSGSTWSWQILGGVIPEEITPIEIKTATDSLYILVSLLGKATSTYFFLSILCYLKFSIFILFGVLAFLMTIFVFFCLPDSKNVASEEMMNLYERHRL